MKEQAEKQNYNRTWAQFWGVVSLLSILFIALSIDYAYRNSDFSFMPFGIIIFSISLVISVFLNWKNILRENKNPHIRDKVILLVANSCSGSFLDILFIFLFIVYCAWIPDSIMDFTNSGDFIWRPVMFIVAFALSILLKPIIPIKNIEVPKSERMVLFTGVSNINYYLRDGKESTNLETVIKPIIDYPHIQLVIILLSDAILFNIEKIASGINPQDEEHSYKYYEIFNGYKERLKEYDGKLKELQNKLRTSDADPEQIKKQIRNEAEPIYKTICEELGSLIKEYIIQSTPPQYHDRCKSIQFEFTKPVDYNNFEECNDRLMEHISAILGRREKAKLVYRDESLLFNISPGTAIVSGVMTLNAIKGKRGLIYIKQESTDKISGKNEIEVKEYDPNVVVLDQQILELMTEKMEQQNNKV